MLSPKPDQQEFEFSENNETRIFLSIIQDKVVVSFDLFGLFVVIFGGGFAYIASFHSNKLPLLFKSL